MGHCYETIQINFFTKNFQYFLKIRNTMNSRLIKRIDLLGQTLILCFIPLGLIFIIFSKEYESTLIVIAAAQFCMGVWQMSSSFLSVIFRGQAFQHKVKHFLLSIIYLVFFGLFVTLYRLGANEGGVFALIFGGLYFFVPPWLLAIYYYRVSWRLVFPNHVSRSKFLPHINF